MARLESLSTEGIAPAKRVAFWNEAICESLTGLSTEPLRPTSFSGRLSRGDVGGLRFVEFSSDAAVIRHSRAHIARSSEAYFIVRLQLAGESVSVQEGREVHLRPGDFTLCDSTRPYQVNFDAYVSTLALRVSKSVLSRYIGSPEALVHRAVSGSDGPGVLASSMLQQVWRASERMIPPEVEPRIEHVALELIASAYVGLGAANVDESCVATTLRVRILQYINDNLQDPELSPTKIAAVFRITPRYVHRLFAREKLTAGRHILTQRLERARAALADPLLRGRSLTRISGDLGFKSLPHFSHVFHEACGMTPSEFREAVRGT